MNGVGYQVLPIGRHAPGAARVHRAPTHRTVPVRSQQVATLPRSESIVRVRNPLTDEE